MRLNTLTIIFIVILCILIGFIFYICYLIFFNPNKINKNNNIGVTQPSVLLSGKVLPGTDLNRTAYCSDQYYLVSNGQATRLVTENVGADAWPTTFAKYRYFTVKVSGESHENDPLCKSENVKRCGCDNYFIVRDITVIQVGVN